MSHVRCSSVLLGDVSKSCPWRGSHCAERRWIWGVVYLGGISLIERMTTDLRWYVGGVFGGCYQ